MPCQTLGLVRGKGFIMKNKSDESALEVKNKSFSGHGRAAAIVLAAGQGKRMKSNIQKQFLILNGKPLIWYALDEFEKSQMINDVILVTGKEAIEYCRDEIVKKYGFSKVRAVISGGKERYHSVYEGLKSLESILTYKEGDIVLVHDGARPFVDESMIERIISDVRICGATAAGMPSKDTVKLSDENGYASVTPKRSSVWTIQTPQGFDYRLIRKAYDKMMSCEEYQNDITDDAMVVETMTDYKVKLTEGSYKNIKVTTPEDMDIAAAFLNKKTIDNNHTHVI